MTMKNAINLTIAFLMALCAIPASAQPYVTETQVKSLIATGGGLPAVTYDSLYSRAYAGQKLNLSGTSTSDSLKARASRITKATVDSGVTALSVTATRATVSSKLTVTDSVVLTGAVGGSVPKFVCADTLGLIYASANPCDE